MRWNRLNKASRLVVLTGSAAISLGAWAQSVEEPPASVVPASEPVPTEQPSSKPSKPTEPEGVVDPAAKERLEKAAKSIQGLKGLTFKINFYAEGDSKDLVGVSEAGVIAARDSGGAWVYRLTGKGQRTGKTPPTNFDMAYLGVNAEWLDAEAKKVFVRPVSQMKGKAVEGSSILTRILRDLLGPTPLGDESRAKNLSVKDDERVGGTDCEIVLASGISGGGALRGGELTVAMGKTDHFPRKFVRETTTSRGTSRMIYELSDIKLDDPEATVDAVHVPLPEGCERDEQAPVKPAATKPPGIKPEGGPPESEIPKAEPMPGIDVASPGTPGDAMAPAGSPVKPVSAPAPTLDVLPDAELKDASGKAVSTSGWRGSPTVVVFWGSWSLTSRKMLAEVEQLATDLGDKGKVFAVAVRQKNLSDAFKAATDARLSKAVALAEGDRLAEQLHIAEYPSILVVTAEGEIRRLAAAVKPSDALQGARGELAVLLGMPSLAPVKPQPASTETSPIDPPLAEPKSGANKGEPASKPE